MRTEPKLDRRRFLAATAGFWVVAAPAVAFARAEDKIDPDEGVTAPEELAQFTPKT